MKSDLSGWFDNSEKYDLSLRALQVERRDKGHLLIMAITSDGF
jgi:hypothetical protein